MRFILLSERPEVRIGGRSEKIVDDNCAQIPYTVEELDEMLLEGLKCGPAIKMNEAEWQRLYEGIESDTVAEHRAS